MKPAVFLDRDGTVIEHVHLLRDPDKVRLVSSAAEAIALLQSRGYACVIVTNQSVVGRGMLTEQGLREIHEVMHGLLARSGVRLDGLYFCPVAPGKGDPLAVEHPDRKPAPGMLRRAARELGLDLARSWMVGDSLTDLLAGRNAGCRGTILVRTGLGQKVDGNHEAIDYVADDLPAAARLIVGLDRIAERGSEAKEGSLS